MFLWPLLQFLLRPQLLTAPHQQFWVYGLSTCTDMKITSADFIGVIFAPTVTLTAAGNASVQGAIVAQSFKCTGNFDFHYDDGTAGNAAKKFQIRSGPSSKPPQKKSVPNRGTPKYTRSR